MGIRAGAYPFGEGAYGALADAVRSAKGDDAFSPVTVLVDRGALGLATRRRLAATPPGVLNVRFVTWSRLAAELAADWLAEGGRRTTSPAGELEAVRAALAGSPASRLASARDQPSTLRALARTYRELAAVPPSALDALGAQSARAAEVVDVVRRARRALQGCVGPAELLEAAAREVRRAPQRAAGVLGALVVYLPRRIGEAELGLLDALGACTDVEIVAGATGDAAADGPLRALLERAAPGRAAPIVVGQEVPAASLIRSAPSADAEVLMALRQLMGESAGGTPLERMALLHSGVAPYPQLVHDAVTRAGIPAYGGSPRPLSATVAGRVLSGLLALPERDWRRSDVAAWLGSGPLLHAGRPVPAAEWDVLSCEAGIVAGRDQWNERMTALKRARPADARGCEELRAFVASLADRLDEVQRSWAEWSAWADRLLGELLGGPAHRAAWPSEDVVAFDAVREALGALGALDWIGGGAPSLGDVRAALGAELDAFAPTTARFGRGLFVGRVDDVVGLDLDVVCIVGMVDGAFPVRSSDDVLVPDDERARAGPGIPLRAISDAEARRDYLAALACARVRVLSYPRFDQRRGRELRPARALLDAVERVAGDGRRRSPRDLQAGVPAGVPVDVYRFVASYGEAVRGDVHDVHRPHGASEPVSVADWGLRSMTRWVTAGRPPVAHFLARTDPALAGALAVRRDRRGARFTRFDGLTERVEVPSPEDALQSATGMESYARCPRRYLFGHLLGITARVLPEAVLQISPADRGILIHRVLERFAAAEIAGVRAEPAEDGDDRSGEDDRLEVEARERRMMAYAEEECAAAARRGVVGHQALWALERSRILSDLRDFVRSDAKLRASTGATPLVVELEFGSAPDAEVPVPITSGRFVRFRGRIDRVDRLADGSLAVIDYKTGTRREPSGDDPLGGGTQLQLFVYAMAARARFGGTHPVRAAYWFIGSAAPPDWLELDEGIERRLATVLGSLADGIEGGRFPARPGPTDGRSATRGAHCGFCPFDAMCPPDRTAAWRRKHEDPVLADYVALVGTT